MVRYRRQVDRPYIAVRTQAEILLVKIGQVMVEFAGEHAAMTKRLQRLMEATQSREQINKTISPQILRPLSLFFVEQQLKLLASMFVQKSLQSVARDKLNRERRSTCLRDQTQLSNSFGSGDTLSRLICGLFVIALCLRISVAKKESTPKCTSLVRRSRCMRDVSQSAVSYLDQRCRDQSCQGQFLTGRREALD